MWSFSLTQPHVDIVGWSRSGVKENIGISSEEVSKQLFGDRFQIHLLYPPNLQTRLLACILELLMENHDSWNIQKYWGWTIKIHTIRRPNGLKVKTTGSVIKQVQNGSYKGKHLNIVLIYIYIYIYIYIQYIYIYIYIYTVYIPYNKVTSNFI